MQNPQPFIDQTFTKLECVHFIPVSRGSDKCGCGRRYNRHSYLLNNWSASIDIKETTSRSWAISRDSRKCPTDSYGVIEFQGGAYARKAQFLRLAFDTPPEQVMKLFEHCWNLERPKLVISVHGGLTNFDLQPKLATAFTKGLLKAAKTTGTWIITSGLNCGVVNYVASALNEAGGSVRARRRLVSIGVAPWGLLENRDDFVGRGVTVQYNNKFPRSSDGRMVTLNEMHTHFLLVDNCTVGRYGADVIMRKRLEKYICQQEISDEANGETEASGRLRYSRNRVPVVGLVLEGGVLTIKTVLDYVTNSPPMPVIVCDGSGRAADLLAFAHKYGDPDLHFPENVKEAVMSLIRLTFSYDGDKALDVYKELTQCLKRKHMITVFRLGEESHTDIDHDILAAWLRCQDITALDRLSLTLSWNRPDIAVSEVFVYGQSWTRSELEAAMMEALLCDRVEFVKLLLEQGVSMGKFLTYRRLEKLYNTRKGPPHTLLWVVKDVVANVHSGYRIRLYDIGLVIEKLVGGDYESSYCTKKLKELYERPVTRVNTAASFFLEHREVVEKEQSFQYPFNDLFLWAVLTKRQSMALCMWERGDEGLAKALVAAKLYDALAEEAADDYLEAEICQDFRNYSREFKQLALDLLDQCYQTDNVLALQLLTYELTNWGRRTCLSVAVSAKYMEFLAHPGCQVLLIDLWHGGMRIRKRSNLRVLLGLLIPPMLFTLEFKTRDELVMQPQTEDERQYVVGYQNMNHASMHKSCSDSSSSSDSDESTGLLKQQRRRNTLFMRSRVLRRLSRMNKERAAEDDDLEAPETKTYGATEGVDSMVSARREPQSREDMEQLPYRKDKVHKRHRLTRTKRAMEFYQAPITTFWSWTISYLVFLCAFTYILLLRTQPYMPSAPEWYVIAFVATYALEMLRRWVVVFDNTIGCNTTFQLAICDAKTFSQKLIVFFTSDVWHLSTAVAIILFFIALGLRFSTSTLAAARILYACTLVFWYVRLLDIMSINNKFGPYITMIAKMIVSMLYIVTILVVTLLAYGVFRQALLHPYEDTWQWDFLRNITYKPYFMWYGEVYANEIDNCREHGLDCVVGSWLSPIALTIYLLVTNILLINLLIAIFNNIFMEVNAVSQILWQFNRYAQVMEYEQKPWLPPPLIIIYYLFRIIKFTCFRECTGRRRPIFDYRLKLFLKSDAIEKLLDFEEECMEDLQRKKNELTSATAGVRLQEAADRTAFISMKLDDVLSKQAANQTVIQNLELEFRAVKDYLYTTSDLTASTSESPGSPISPLGRKSVTPQTTPRNLEDYHRLQHGPLIGEDQEDIEGGASPSEDSVNMSARRAVERYIDRSLSSPWSHARRSMSTGSKSSGRKMSILHRNFEYSTIADGIDVGDCAQYNENDWRRRAQSTACAPLPRTVFPTLTPVSSRCDDVGSENEQNVGDEEENREEVLKRFEEQGLQAGATHEVDEESAEDKK